MTIYERALEFVADGGAVGLGSGRASTEFIRLLGARVRAGLRVRGVPTSRQSADLAESLGIPLVTLEEGMPLALTVDGADEVDPDLNLIKGYGRALVREKIVAAASRSLVILVGPGKTVPGPGRARQAAGRGRAVRAAALRGPAARPGPASGPLRARRQALPFR